MPIYYVNLRTAGGVFPPLESEEFADLDALTTECLAAAKQIIGDALAHGAPLDGELLDRSFEVTDQSGETVLSVPFVSSLAADTRGQ